jgi:hypothetical protein
VPTVAATIVEVWTIFQLSLCLSKLIKEMQRKVDEKLAGNPFTEARNNFFDSTPKAKYHNPCLA